MKIHFSNVNFHSRTGPNSFAHRLGTELVSRGHQIVPAHEDYDVFLAFIEAASQPRPGALFIQRLDGIWFKPDQFETHNRSIKWAYDNADHVIWQSQFDKEMTTHHWGDRAGTVIRNGVDTSKPNRLTASLEGDPVIVCASNWHPQKRLAQNVELFMKIRESHPGAKLYIMGNASPSEIDPYIGRSVTYLGSLTHDECLAVYNRADWMIHLAWLDHCPNVVVEALSQACPVICSSAGGTKELVGRYGVIIDDEPYHYQLTDYDNPPSLNFDGFVLPEAPSIMTTDFDINLTADMYERVFRGES